MNGTNLPEWRALLRVLLKAGLLFLALNIAFALLQPLDALGRLSIYNWLVPGRVRLPYGELPESYNLIVNNIPAMFASHEIERPNASDEFRVIVLGDSSVWGVLLRPEETLTTQINAAGIMVDNGRQIRAYNLGHPVLSLTKDLLILDEAMQYQPDMIVWLMTLQSFPRKTQFDAPLVQASAMRVKRLFRSDDLDYALDDPRLADGNLWQRSIIGQRRNLADWLRLQLYGVVWGITGIDQVYRDDYQWRTSDFDEDISWQDYAEPVALTEEDLAFDILAVGQERAGDIPVLFVNEPTFISSGQNSDLRYNLWYPRWAYDSYRGLYQSVVEQNAWNYVDLWDLIVPTEFTDSPVHLTPDGSAQLAQRLGQEIAQIANRNAENG